MNIFICPTCGDLIRSDEESVICHKCGNKIGSRSKIATLKKMKDKAWSQFSRYIRLRDCINTTGTNTEGICYTCGKRLPINKLQAGHMISGRTNSVLFDEQSVQIQCYSCNVMKSGRQGLFVLHKIDDLVSSGSSYEQAVNIIKDRFNAPNKRYSLDDLADLYVKYKSLSDRLEDNNA